MHKHAAQPQIALQECLKTAILGGLGLYFVAMIASGNLANYVNVRFAWLSYVAAALFLLLSLSSLLHLREARRHNHEHQEHNHEPHEHEHQHDHSHPTITWPALAVVAIPLLLGTLIPSQPLGAAAVDGDLSVSSTQADSAAAYGIPPDKRNILDWLRAFNVAEDMSSFNGQPADIIGFVYRDKDYAPDQFMVARFAISCCVANSIAVGLPVQWSQALDADTWVRISGQWQMGSFREESQPVIQPDTVEVIDQPEHPYLYP